MAIPRTRAGDSVLLVVDVQEKLLLKMPAADALVRDVGFLIDAAKLLEIPVVATEQYPTGLGPTHPEITRRLPGVLPDKLTFSCCGVMGLLDHTSAAGRSSVVVCGMETHVCVMQTTLDLLEAGYRVFLPVDALQSRSQLDHDAAIRRMEAAGAVPTTVEAVAFEWLGTAQHSQFKTISKMIQTRMAAKAGG